MVIFTDDRQSCLMGVDALQRELQTLDIIATLGQFLGGGADPNDNEISPDFPVIDKSFRSKRKRKVHFTPTVQVVKIPARMDYPDEIKQAMWSSSAEINQNARRNRREFASEDWNPENVVEEDQMFFDKRSNEYIHPVHLGGVMNLR
mmetsp:Transcript_1068/g.1514  ORF Transcript_1068/g.1514 Transcript_1068/m.1514 type:complete len:147 (+) Transcript_1068:119-559(+)